MPDIIISILLILIGIIVGIIVMFIINHFKKNSASKKAEMILKDAEASGEKIKKDYINEAKNEANEIKRKQEEEIKERKALLKYEIDDMRLLYENDIRFLKQF